jgi:hypothetical protein
MDTPAFLCPIGTKITPLSVVQTSTNGQWPMLPILPWHRSLPDIDTLTNGLEDLSSFCAYCTNAHHYFCATQTKHSATKNGYNVGRAIEPRTDVRGIFYAFFQTKKNASRLKNPSASLGLIQL